MIAYAIVSSGLPIQFCIKYRLGFLSEFLDDGLFESLVQDSHPVLLSIHDGSVGHCQDFSAQDLFRIHSPGLNHELKLLHLGQLCSRSNVQLASPILMPF